MDRWKFLFLSFLFFPMRHLWLFSKAGISKGYTSRRLVMHARPTDAFHFGYAH
jgi:hypothetical protein